MLKFNKEKRINLNELSQVTNQNDNIMDLNYAI